MPLIDARLLRLSTLYAPTLKEDPVDAEIASHKLLIRAAMIRKAAAGVYSFLPLGFRVLRKAEQIIREEQNNIGAQEMVMSIIQPAELWHESGRWDVYGPELMRFEDRHGRGFALSPTQEELITSLVRDELRSYRELPKSLYHIQWKYRDEIRPRFGLLRGREFIMKDGYSFHDSEKSLQKHYDEQSRAYGRICERMGLDWRAVDADSGQIGGKVTTEFMALADAGEASILYCDCGFAANTEVASAEFVLGEYCPGNTAGARDDGSSEHAGYRFEGAEGASTGARTGSSSDNAKGACNDNPGTQAESRTDSATGAPVKVHTPGVAAIADLAVFLGIGEEATVKALAGKDSEGQASVLFIPGSHELSELKVLGHIPSFELLDDEDMERFGLVKGFMGPVGLPEGVQVVADESLRAVASWLVGANQTDYHLAGAVCGRDFEVDVWADITEASPGDLCPACGSPLKGARGIEVGQVFQLGTKYSDVMGATYMDAEGEEHPFIMGCYGWGVTRSLAAVVEQHNDDDGIVWPISVAPSEVAVIALTVGDDLVAPAAEQLAQHLTELGVETVIDDRDERAGVKFNDADLIGWPFQLIVGKRGLKNNTVELKTRATGEKAELGCTEAARVVARLVEEQRRRYL